MSGRIYPNSVSHVIQLKKFLRLGGSVRRVSFKVTPGRSLVRLLLVVAFSGFLFASLVSGRVRADIIIDQDNSAGQLQTIAAPGNHTQTTNFTDNANFAVDINATNGANGTFRIDPGVTLTGAGGSAVVVRSLTTLSGFDVQGTLRATNFNALNLNASGTISNFSNSGTIESSSNSSATLFLPGTVTNFSNSGTIDQTSAAAITSVILDRSTMATNQAAGTIRSGNGMAVRLGFSNAATIGDFINNGMIEGGTIGIELGRQAGSAVGLTNSGSITGVTAGLQVRNGSELTSFDNSGGTIEATGANGAALQLREDQNVAITNSGTLRSTSTGNGLLIDSEAQTQDFTNSAGATISSTSGTAIVAETAMTGHSGGFVNNGDITGGGGSAIDARDAFTLTNSGTVSGNITQTGSGALAVNQTGGSITGNITSSANAAHSLALSGGTVNGDIGLDGFVANSLTLDGTAVTGNVDLGDGAAHSVNLRRGSISGTLDVGTGTTAVDINVAGGNSLSIGSLATNNATVTNITGAGDVNVTSFNAAGTVNQTAGRLTGSLSVATGGNFTQTGASVLDATNVTLNGTAALNLNGTTARVTGAVSGGTDSRVAVNGSFSSENSFSVGQFEVGNSATLNLGHDVSLSAAGPSGFTVGGAVNQTAGTLTAAGLTVSTGGSFTQTGASVLDATNVTLNGTAALNLNGTTARVTGTVSGGTDSRVAVNGNFSSENSFSVGRFEVGSGGRFEMGHDVTVSAVSPAAFGNFGTLAIAAGNTATINGNYTQDPNGVFQVGVTNDTVFGKLVVTGTASLPSSARIDVDVTNPNFNFTTNDLLGVITASTLTSDGTFSVTDNSVLFDFGAEVAGDAVNLTLAAAAGGGGSHGVHDAVVANENWPGVGAAIVFDDLIDVFLVQGTSGNGAMDAVLGALGVLGSQQSVSSAVSDTLPLLTASAALPIKNNLASTRRILRSRLSDKDWTSTEDQTFAEKQIWAVPFYNGQDHGDSGAVTGFNGRSKGLVFGADGNIDADIHLGLAFAYSGTEVDSNDKRHSADIESYQLLGYGRYALTDVTEVDFQMGLGFSETDGERRITFLDDTPTARARYDGMNFHLGGGIGQTIQLGDDAQFIPAVRVDYMRFDSEGYRETGAGALNLVAESDELEALELGVSGNLRYRISNEASLVASFGAVYDTLNERPKVISRFAGGGEAFVTSGIDASPWTGHLGLGLPITLGDKAHIALRYDVEAREDYNNQTASVKIGLDF